MGLVKYILFFIGLLISFVCIGQTEFKSKETDLAFYADVMINAQKPEHRIKSELMFRNRFLDVISEEGSFEYPFDSLKWISKLTASDNTFRVFTWQLKDDNDLMSYHGVVQKNDGSFFELRDVENEITDLNYQSFYDYSWYGQLYYDIFEQKDGEQTIFILFGYREIDKNKKQKIAERIILTEEGVIFGDELFFNENARHGKSRISIEYAAVTKASLRYDHELDLIIYDHLIPVINPYEDNEMMMVPEGTYEAYYYKNGKWNYQEKVFDQIYEKPPMPNPVLKNRDKNIIGK